MFNQYWDYFLDLYQRNILFFDAFRQRANNMLEHEQAGLPPVLNFEYETILDARKFEPPANYALLKITAVGDNCLEDCLDKKKPPVIIVDPRAGHGPGIGGFKRESEVGIAMHEGHPVYFASFFPEPCPSQDISDVLHALRKFIDEVSKRHNGSKPILYGNCQAGWLIALLCADCVGLVGPAVLNGSPLSYWAGEDTINPMRLSGGLFGGSWVVKWLAEMNNGLFDGAWLVQNFENLNPANTLWKKNYELFSEIDTETERFLEFERWWNGYYQFSGQEIVSTVENLFIGDKLEKGLFRICEGCYADIKRIHNPILVFASSGDNITPPHQALNWIPTVYQTTAELKKYKQRIVYLLNTHIGHLGIFVSANVARFEHRAILESVEDLEKLAPGLYEMKISNPSGDLDCHKPKYTVIFEERQVENIHYQFQTEPFERVEKISELNKHLYQLYVQPWIFPYNPILLKWFHPMRLSKYIYSERINPLMTMLPSISDIIRKNRRPINKDNAFKKIETQYSELISDKLDTYKKIRDQNLSFLFNFIYSSPMINYLLDKNGVV